MTLMRKERPAREAHRVLRPAFWSGASDPRVWSVFFTQAMLRGWREFLPSVGYGLYAARKSSGRIDEEE